MIRTSGQRRVGRERAGRKRPGTSGVPIVAVMCAAMTLLPACQDGGGVTTPGNNVLFGLDGRIRMTFQGLPSTLDTLGGIRQILTWESSGRWTFEEEISYRGVPGDRTVLAGPANATADGYSSLVVQIGTSGGDLDFVGDTLTLDGVPDCRGLVTGDLILPFVSLEFEVEDDIRTETRTWRLCTQTWLGGDGADRRIRAVPDQPPLSLEVAAAAEITRDRTLTRDFGSTYRDSSPYQTLDRADDSGFPLEGPLVFIDGERVGGGDVLSWDEFWAAHKGGAVPAVDWSRDMVLVAAVGTRQELGDSIEVRRVIPAATNTVVEIAERIPGDFCSPLSREHRPVHIVATPRIRSLSAGEAEDGGGEDRPVIFRDPVEERFSCGAM